MNINSILQLLEKPAPFTPGEPLFWDDPHISEQMLKAHLDSGNHLASRRPETIQRSVDWLIETLGLQTGASLNLIVNRETIIGIPALRAIT